MTNHASGSRRGAAICVVLAGVLVLAATPAAAREAGCPVEKDRLTAAVERGRALVARFRDLRPIAGTSIAVSLCGEIVWAEGFGLADLEQKVPVTPETRFRVGSVSKTFTAAAVGQAVERGLLDLDAEIQTYVPDFPRKAHPVTARLLGGHLAGIRHYKDNEYLISEFYPTVSAGLAIFKDDPLINRPGTEFRYTSHGWNLLSAVVEGAADEAFLDYMADNVFAPAGMEDTGPDLNAEIIPDRTRFYYFDPDTKEPRNAPYVDNSYKWAGGGFLSTPTDILKFSHAMVDGTLVAPETLTLLTTSQQTEAGEETGYGIGWFTDLGPRAVRATTSVFGDDEGTALRARIGETRFIGHGGSSVGGQTVFLTAPDAPGAVAVAAVTNSGAVPVYAFPVAVDFMAVAGNTP